MTKKKKTDENISVPESIGGNEMSSVKEAVQDSAQAEALSKAEQEILTLKQQVAEARTQADEYKDGWQRALADFANLRRRVERDQQNANQNATINVIKRYLEIVDDLDRALTNRPKEGDAVRWAEGIELTYRKLTNFLENEGLTTIPVDGEFDSNIHEAISHEDSPQHSSGQIIGVVQQGYRLGERIVRPARVRVAR